MQLHPLHPRFLHQWLDLRKNALWRNHSFVPKQSTVCGSDPNANRRSSMIFDSFSLNACNLLSNCFVEKLLSDAYIGLAIPVIPLPLTPSLRPLCIPEGLGTKSLRSFSLQRSFLHLYRKGLSLYWLGPPRPVRLCRSCWFLKACGKLQATRWWADSSFCCRFGTNVH